MGSKTKCFILAFIIFAALMIVIFALFVPKRCAKVSDGLKKLSLAVDVTKLDLLPYSSASISKGFGRSVFQFTCNRNKRWTDPLTSIVYDLPDQIEVLNRLPNDIFDAYNTMYESLEELKMDLASGVNINYKEGMFSASGSYRRAQETMENNSNHIAEVSAYFSAFRVHLDPYLITSPVENFLHFVKYELPETFQENPQKYQKLFREYGTHYFTGGNFGGLFRLRITLDKRLRNELTGKNIELAIYATFLDSLKRIGAHRDDINEINPKFRSLSQVTARFYGGNVSIEGPAEWNKWSQSVPKNPWLLSGHLSEISNLIPDDRKKEAVKFAMEVHLADAYLQDLVINLKNYLKRNNIEEKNNKTANKFMKQSENIFSKNPVDVRAVKSLALEVKQFLFQNKPPETMNEFGVLQIVIISADVSDKRFLPIRPDPFIKVYAAGYYLGQTSVATGTTKPFWKDKFASQRIHVSSTVRFDFYHEKTYKDVYIDSVSVSVKDILHRNLNATETSLFQYDLHVKITWYPLPEP